MSTAEIAVETLLAGIVGLLICVLPFIDVVQAAAQLESTIVSVGVLGTAYMLGAVFDKLFDTTTGGLEAWQRLVVAERRRGKSTDVKDWFDQATLEAKARTSESAATWMQHLRTRVRLTRTLAIGAPLIALSIAISIWLSKRDIDMIEGVVRSPDFYEWLIALSPALLIVVSLIVASAVKVTRTDEWKFPENGGYVEQAKAWLPVVLVYALAAATIAFLGTPILIVPAFMIGAAGLWSWRRILNSYMLYVASHDNGNSSTLESP